MPQGRPTEMISLIRWIRTIRLSIKKSFSWQEGSVRQDLEVLMTVVEDPLAHASKNPIGPYAWCYCRVL